MKAAVPIFPAGVVSIFENPNKFSEKFNLDNFKVEKYAGTNKYRSEKFKNIIKDESLSELYDWINDCIKQYLDQVIYLKYENFFISESWLNVNEKGGDQPIHNHPNAIISGVYYMKMGENHPPLNFHRTRPSDKHPFISLSEHYKSIPQYRGPHPNVSNSVGFPCEQDTMLVFQSQLYHFHNPVQTDEQRISLSWNALVNFEIPEKPDTENFYNSYNYRIRFEQVD